MFWFTSKLDELKRALPRLSIIKRSQGGYLLQLSYLDITENSEARSFLDFDVLQVHILLYRVAEALVDRHRAKELKRVEEH